MNLYEALIYNNTWKIFKSNLTIRELFKMLNENDFFIEIDTLTKKETIYNVDSIKTITKSICKDCEVPDYEKSIIEFI